MDNKCRDGQISIKGKCKDKEEVTVQELAKEYNRYFVRDERKDGKKFWKTKDERPQELHDLIMEAHGDMMPDDYRYEFIESSLSIIAESEDPDESIDQVDESVDIYTHELIDWLGSRTDRYGFVDEAVEDMGHGDSITDDITRGQMKEREEVHSSVLQSLRKILEQ
jgi:hypothetical protein